MHYFSCVYIVLMIYGDVSITNDYQLTSHQCGARSRSPK